VSKNPARALVELGFNEVEASAYCELLKDGPATAYRLATAIHRAPSNIYQTLESLCRKGAIVADTAEPRTFRAVTARELLKSLEQGFRRRTQGALESLRTMESDAPDDRLYNLRTVEQVFDRARRMLEEARDVVLFDLFPDPFRRLVNSLQASTTKGTTVAGISYGAPPRVKGIEVYAHPWEAIARAWPGQQATIVADAKATLVALLSRDGESVRHAMWTDSVYLSCLHHAGLACEIQASVKGREPQDPIVRLGLLTQSPPGLRVLTGESARANQRSKRRRSGDRQQSPRRLPKMAEP